MAEGASEYAAGGRAPSGPVELRIHGVGGSTPEGLLGERHPDDVLELRRGHRTGLWARRRDPLVQGYVWGGLTSGAKLQPLWLVLLPFTLANVAGWMHPPITGDPRRRSQIRDIRRLVTALGYTLTISWALWLAIVVGDLLVYQGGGNVKALDFAPFASMLAAGLVVLIAGLAWKRWLPLMILGATIMAVAAAWRWLDNDYARAVGGVLAAEAILAVLAVIAGVSRSRYENHSAESVHEVSDRDTPGDEDLRSPTFFARPKVSQRLLVRHALLVAAVTVLLLIRAVARAEDGGGEGGHSLSFGTSVVGVGALQFALLALLSIRSLGEFDKRRQRWQFAGPAVAMGLALTYTTGVFSGLTMFVANRVDESVTGGELALVDVFVADALVVALVLLLGWVPYFLSGRPPKAQPGESPQEAKWRKPRDVRKRLARVLRHIDVICSVGVGFLVIAGLAATITRTDLNSSWLPWEWTIDAEAGLRPLRNAGAWLLPFAVPAVGALIRTGHRSVAQRRNIGNLWDVLGLWPRHFHPLAVRPYAERAVPELQDHIRRAVVEGHPVIVSAHSQGSVLAFAALSGLAGRQRTGNADDVYLLDHVALVTYGSPLARLHARFFPAFVGPELLGWLPQYLVSWHNFFHCTDHIGQKVFEEVKQTPGGTEAAGEDIELPDPAEGDVDPRLPEGICFALEPDRTPWSGIAGHNEYPREPALKQCVRDLKAQMGSGIAAPADG